MKPDRWLSTADGGRGARAGARAAAVRRPDGSSGDSTSVRAAHRADGTRGVHATAQRPAEQSADTEPSLRTVTECTICRTATAAIRCSTVEMQRQLADLAQFHRRRLRQTSAGGNELADRADFTHDYVTDIVQCDGCGFVFRRQQPVPAADTELYAQDQYGQERLAALFTAQLPLFRPRVERLAEMLRPAGPAAQVIEIGSFVGGFLTAAKERGWHAVGIDPGREVGAFCRARGLSVLQSDATSAHIAAASSDAVCVWNTFDQLPDVRATLETITRWLRPGGVLAVRVPNGACFAACMERLRAWPRFATHPLRAAMAWNNLLGFPYLNGYARDTLDRLMGSFNLHRLALHPSVLPRLADERTRRWAACEEQCLKRVWRAVTRYDADSAPWFDAYYRLGGPLRAV